MSDYNKKHDKGGGGKQKHAEAGQSKKTLQECVLNAWKDLRPALEVGAADKTYVTAMELISNDKVSVNLTITNPRTLEEESLNTANINRFMLYELMDLTRERQLAIRRIARRAAAAPVGVVDENDGTVTMIKREGLCVFTCIQCMQVVIDYWL